jgi:hypothetical protein
MLDQLQNYAADAVTDTLLTTAFIDPLPAEASATAATPDRPLQALIRFCAPEPATLRILAPEPFGRALAANVLGTDPAADDAAGHARDALAELANVSCGALLARLTADGRAGVTMSLPELTAVEDASAWADAVARPGARLFDADGHPLVVVVEGDMR